MIGLTEDADTSLNVTDYSKEECLLSLVGFCCFISFDTLSVMSRCKKLRLLWIIYAKKRGMLKLSKLSVIVELTMVADMGHKSLASCSFKFS